MSLTLRWVGEADFDRIARVRTLCYAHGPKELEHHDRVLRADPRPRNGDFLLAEENGEPVGTTTALSLTTWIRGSPLPCQGIAYVGTIRTHRRRIPSAGSRGGVGGGVASQLMHEALRVARERGQVLSALMPFRASFYEHFGYGVVERRVDWTVPMSLLPTGEFDDLRFSRPGEREAIAACHQRAVERGQCDMERDAERWRHMEAQSGDWFEVIDRPSAAAPVRGFLHYNQYQKDGKDIVRVLGHAADDLAAFRRQLHFLASLKDQYHAATITMPADRPLNWLLKERQVPHRLVNHATAEVRPYTRMQVRVLDHARLIDAMHLPQGMRGEATIAVHEAEGHVTKFLLALDGNGRASAKPSDASADVECDDCTWAAVVLGDLPVQTTAAMGLIEVKQAKALTALSALAAGPVPFCEEYF